MSEIVRVNKCYYFGDDDPNVLIIGEHTWGKDGYCCICDERRPTKDALDGLKASRKKSRLLSRSKSLASKSRRK